MPSNGHPKKKYGFGKANLGHDLELPSHEDPSDPQSPHNVVLVRRPGVQGLIAAGVLDNLDNLTALVKTEHLDRVEGREAAKLEGISLLKDNREDIIKALALVDKVVLHCVLEPKLFPTPADEADRVPEKMYVDEVDLDDRMFILQYAMGGSKDLESFRKETDGGLAGVAAK